jgi:hypothetical protein
MGGGRRAAAGQVGKGATPVGELVGRGCRERLGGGLGLGNDKFWALGCTWAGGGVAKLGCLGCFGLKEEFGALIVRSVVVFSFFYIIYI